MPSPANPSVSWLQAQLSEQYGPFAERIWNGYFSQRVTSLRVNTLKTDVRQVIAALQQENLEPEALGFYQDALTLPAGAEPSVRKIRIYEAGEIYLQSLSSMIPPLFLDVQPGQDVLDMCAAPGGKTSEIVQLAGGQCMVTACEPDRIRCDRLRANLRRLGCERVNVLNQDARHLDDLLKFDRILLDAPCSGSGTLQLGDDSRKLAFSPKLVSNSARLQEQLLKKAFALLKRGGRLVYSTCSLLRQENEDQISAVLKTGRMRLIPISNDTLTDVPNVRNALPGSWTVPPDQHFEGFYISVLEKTG